MFVTKRHKTVPISRERMPRAEFEVSARELRCLSVLEAGAGGVAPREAMAMRTRLQHSLAVPVVVEAICAQVALGSA